VVRRGTLSVRPHQLSTRNCRNQAIPLTENLAVPRPISEIAIFRQFESDCLRDAMVNVLTLVTWQSRSMWRRIGLEPHEPMKTAVMLFAVFVVSSAAFAQKSGKMPLFTHETSLCAGSGFVAMVSFSRPQSLTVVTVSSKGIGAPQTILTTGNEVFGLQCMGSHLELRVRQGESDHFSVLPFSVSGDTIQPEAREDIDWSIARNGTMPSVIERRIERFDVGAGAGMRGDWYVHVGDTPGHIYVLHFVEAERSDRGLETRLTVDLLSETYDHKIVQAVPLIHFERFEAAD
jgi:hypothetical protein